MSSSTRCHFCPPVSAQPAWLSLYKSPLSLSEGVLQPRGAAGLLQAGWKFREHHQPPRVGVRWMSALPWLSGGVWGVLSLSERPRMVWPSLANNGTQLITGLPLSASSIYQATHNSYDHLSSNLHPKLFSEGNPIQNNSSHLMELWKFNEMMHVKKRDGAIQTKQPTNINYNCCHRYPIRVTLE